MTSLERTRQESKVIPLTPGQKRYLLYSLGDPFEIGDPTDLEYQRWQREIENPQPNAYSMVIDHLLVSRRFLKPRVVPDTVERIDHFLRDLCDQHKKWKESSLRDVIGLIKRNELNTLEDIILDIGEAEAQKYQYYAMTPYGLTLEPGDDADRALGEISARFQSDKYKHNTIEEIESAWQEGIETFIPGVIFQIRRILGSNFNLNFGISREAQLKAIQTPLIKLPTEITSRERASVIA